MFTHGAGAVYVLVMRWLSMQQPSTTGSSGGDAVSGGTSGVSGNKNSTVVNPAVSADRYAVV